MCTYCRDDSDPYDTGIDFLDYSDDHIRTKRSSPNKRFKIHATNVDWRKMIGSPDVGASFGVVLKNTLDLNIGMQKLHREQIIS